MEVAKQRTSRESASSGTAPARTAVSRQSLPPDADEPDRNYRAVLGWVWSFSERPRSAAALADQRAHKLERMRALLAALGNPQDGYPSVLVAGTKGKGSTVAMLAAALRAAGHRVGRYTSPHLVNWRERIWLDGAAIGVDEVLALAPDVRAAVARVPDEPGPLTTFEVGTAFALLHFARAGVEVAVIEVGVGGRFDATNTVEPRVSAITPISFDHTPTLGTTLDAIARHKAGVLRAGRTGVLAPQPAEARETVEREAASLGARLVEVGGGRDWWWRRLPDDPAGAVEIASRLPGVAPSRVRVGLLGDHQRDNATTAAAALHALGAASPALATPPGAVVAGLEQVDWPGRLQVLRRAPTLVLDGAHNAASAVALRQAVEAELPHRRLLLVLGLSAGKDAAGVLAALLPGAASVYLTRARHERAIDPADLASLIRGLAPDARAVVQNPARAAVEAALAAAGPEDLVLVTGSLFLVGEVLAWWQGQPSR